jgi:hypothetical protein
MPACFCSLLLLQDQIMMLVCLLISCVEDRGCDMVWSLMEEVCLHYFLDGAEKVEIRAIFGSFYG